MKGIESLENIVAIQLSSGNWNCNSYQLGLANGLILALAIMKDEEPNYLSRPDVWLDDLPLPDKVAYNPFTSPLDHPESVKAIDEIAAVIERKE
jgi:hypothetical protein